MKERLLKQIFRLKKVLTLDEEQFLEKLGNSQVTRGVAGNGRLHLDIKQAASTDSFKSNAKVAHDIVKSYNKKAG